MVFEAQKCLRVFHPLSLLLLSCLLQCDKESLRSLLWWWERFTSWSSVVAFFPRILQQYCLCRVHSPWLWPQKLYLEKCRYCGRKFPAQRTVMNACCALANNTTSPIAEYSSSSRIKLGRKEPQKSTVWQPSRKMSKHNADSHSWEIGLIIFSSDGSKTNSGPFGSI